MPGILPTAIQITALVPATISFPENWGFCFEKPGFSPISAAGGTQPQSVNHMAVFLLKHYPTPTSCEGLFTFPKTLGCSLATPNKQACPKAFPSNTGISPTEELLCEMSCFLMSCHLSLLLMYTHAAINCFGTSVTPLMCENQNVDQNVEVFSPKLCAANVILLKSIRRELAGTWHH